MELILVILGLALELTRAILGLALESTRVILGLGVADLFHLAAALAAEEGYPQEALVDAVLAVVVVLAADAVLAAGAALAAGVAPKRRAARLALINLATHLSLASVDA